MHFLSLLPFGLFILVPGIILLYILKQKSQDKDISSLYLWRETYKNIEASTPWEKLKNNLLMYIQIAVIISIILALAGPYIANMGKESKNVIMVFDNSGSMNALYNEKESRLDAAKKKAVEYVEQWGGQVNVTLLCSNQNTRVVLSNNKDTRKIKEAIYSLDSTDVEGDLNGSVSMVKSMAEQWDSYEALFFTDSSLNLGKINGNLVDVSSQKDNVSVDYISCEYTKENEISGVAKVTNHGRENINGDINLYVNDKIVKIEKTGEIKPGENANVYFENIPLKNKEESIVICAEWNEKDALEADNRSYTQLGVGEKTKVLLISEQNIFLEKAILTMEQVDLYKANSIEAANETGDYDLYIYDGVTPDTLPEGNVVLINPTETEGCKEIFSYKEENKEGAVVNINPQSYTRLIDNDFSFGVGKYKVLKPRGNAEIFLKSKKDSLGFIVERKKGKVGVIAFDIHNSDFPLQTEYPILMNQLLGQMIKTELLSEKVITAGENYEINQVSYTKEKVGVYSVSGESVEGTKEETLVVNFPTGKESDLINEVVQSNEKNKKEQNNSIGIIGTINIKPYFIWIAFILVGIEWIAYLKWK